MHAIISNTAMHEKIGIRYRSGATGAYIADAVKRTITTTPRDFLGMPSWYGLDLIL